MRWLATVVALVAFLPTAQACNIPVFRYALDRWRPDRYEFIVFHRGALSELDQKLFNRFQQYADRPDCPANFNLTRVDLSKNRDPSLEKLYQSSGRPPLPCLVVRYPDMADIDASVWTGPFQEKALAALLDSPARREIARRIWRGESAVWVLLDSGDPAKDQPAEEVVRTTLARLEKTLKLPELTDAPKDKLLNPDGPKVRLSFSVLRLSRTEPAEAMLVRMLAHTEEGLAQRQEPMVFPIFGRGIVLHALVGKGITAKNLGESAGFLVGACSCEVKRLNPGVDLLMTADWERGTGPEVFRAESLHQESGVRGQESGVKRTPDSRFLTPGSSHLIRNMSVAVVGGLVILALFSFWRRYGERHSPTNHSGSQP